MSDEIKKLRKTTTANYKAAAKATRDTAKAASVLTERVNQISIAWEQVYDGFKKSGWNGLAIQIQHFVRVATDAGFFDRADVVFESAGPDDKFAWFFVKEGLGLTVDELTAVIDNIASKENNPRFPTWLNVFRNSLPSLFFFDISAVDDVATTEATGKPPKTLDKKPISNRGRVKGSVAPGNDINFDRRVSEAWARGKGQYKSIQELARGFNVDRQVAWDAKERHRKRL